tara:strand:+ start:68 stop:1624 length:1557 start_codon:yes stop_codon:yes gene_type:complete
LKSDSIVIVGGGTAGFMTATTLIKLFPNKKVSLIESPRIKTVGVGESTIVQFRKWMGLVGIKDEDFMKECNASYKFNIRFTDFHKKDNTYFDYPFGATFVPDKNKFTIWYLKKMAYPDIPLTDYADSFCPFMALVNNNAVHENKNNELGEWDFYKETAWHFDATKFGLWLKDKICIPNGLKHITATVKDIKTNDKGIEHILLDNGDEIKADLFIDCTGFKSLLLGGALKEEFTSYNDILPNNKAIATHIPYKNKDKELVGYTNCTAIENGWVWNIPLWESVGTGYVYSDKYVTEEQALKEFKKHLKKNGVDVKDLSFNHLDMRIGMHKRIFVKNVCAIGLSAGFIEPLESNGLYTVHEFLSKLISLFKRDNISQFDKDGFNIVCKGTFHSWAEFVALHYALSERDDTPYWRDNMDREYVNSYYNMLTNSSSDMQKTITGKFLEGAFEDVAGIRYIATGMNWFPTSKEQIMYINTLHDLDLKPFEPSFDEMDKFKKQWNEAVKDSPTLYKYLKDNIYKT